MSELNDQIEILIKDIENVEVEFHKMLLCGDHFESIHGLPTIYDSSFKTLKHVKGKIMVLYMVDNNAKKEIIELRN